MGLYFLAGRLCAKLEAKLEAKRVEKIPSSFFSRLTRQIKPLNEVIARDKSCQLRRQADF